ncbi:MAG: hypothetical protein WCP31_00080 [Chloroflexales bacterium]
MASPALTLTVAPRFTRSVHLSRDHRRDDALQGYQLTPLVAQVLERRCLTKDIRRSWAFMATRRSMQ